MVEGATIRIDINFMNCGYLVYIGDYTANMESTQIIATSHDLTLNGSLAREITLFQGNPGW